MSVCGYLTTAVTAAVKDRVAQRHRCIFVAAKNDQLPEPLPVKVDAL